MDLLDSGYAFIYNMNSELDFKIVLRYKELAMLRLKKLLCALLALAAMLAGCAFAGEYPTIVCTSFPCYDFARAVVGDQGHVQMLIKPGAEVHSYEPTPADIMAIAGCDLFVYVGGESDAWVEDILASFGSEAPETLRFFDYMEEFEEAQHDHAHDDHALEYDEHIWTNPKNAMVMVEALAEKICETYGLSSDVYRANADAYITEIAEIDAAFAEIAADSVRREMIFADRFPFIYFAHEYGIEWKAAFESCSSESEPSAKTMMELIDHIIRNDVPVVYTIELSNAKTAKTIANETGVEICTFHSVQNVTEVDFAAGETYVSLMNKNVEALQKGLN